MPPGPSNAKFLGVAVVNAPTVVSQDDDYILCEPCSRVFDFRALVVSDLAKLAKEAYAYGRAMSDAIAKASS